MKRLNDQFIIGVDHGYGNITDRQASPPVAFLCVTDTKAKSRFTCTTDLTHGESRSPLPRYGRHY